MFFFLSHRRNVFPPRNVFVSWALKSWRLQTHECCVMESKDSCFWAEHSPPLRSAPRFSPIAFFLCFAGKSEPAEAPTPAAPWFPWWEARPNREEDLACPSSVPLHEFNQEIYRSVKLPDQSHYLLRCIGRRSLNTPCWFATITVLLSIVFVFWSLNRAVCPDTQTRVCHQSFMPLLELGNLRLKLVV